jgi:hypothetical protein
MVACWVYEHRHSCIEFVEDIACHCTTEDSRSTRNKFHISCQRSSPLNFTSSWNRIIVGNCVVKFENRKIKDFLSLAIKFVEYAHGELDCCNVDHVTCCVRISLQCDQHSVPRTKLSLYLYQAGTMPSTGSVHYV